jgi:hypothetical protein
MGFGLCPSELLPQIVDVSSSVGDSRFINSSFPQTLMRVPRIADEGLASRLLVRCLRAWLAAQRSAKAQ